VILDELETSRIEKIRAAKIVKTFMVQLLWRLPPQIHADKHK
jgi:hypothetical protein